MKTYVISKCANPKCNEEFTPTGSRQKYCCTRCRDHAMHARQAKREAELNVKWCATCGKQLSKKQSKYCSVECRMIAYGRTRGDYEPRRIVRGRGAKPKLSIAEVNKLARAEGLSSYGQYFSRHGYDEWPETKRFVQGG